LVYGIVYGMVQKIRNFRVEASFSRKYKIPQ
jgi:hypothetical protein